MVSRDRISPILIAGIIIIFTVISLIVNNRFRNHLFQIQQNEKLNSALISSHFLLEQYLKERNIPFSNLLNHDHQELDRLITEHFHKLGMTNGFIYTLYQENWQLVSGNHSLSDNKNLDFRIQMSLQQALAQKSHLSTLEIIQNKQKLRMLFKEFKTESSSTPVIIGAELNTSTDSKSQGALMSSILISLVFLFLALLLFLIYHVFFRSRQSNMLKEVFSDQLTLLPNRNQLLNDLKDSRDPVLIIINVQSFKHINNFYGTDMGDFILLSLSAHLQSLMKEVDQQLYRIQADEFAILLNREFFHNDLLRLLEYLSTGINEKIFRFQDHEINISTYIGVSMPDKEEKQNFQLDLWQKVMTQADTALKHCREQHIPYVIYDKSMNLDHEIATNIKWTKVVRDAIRHDRIVPYFQPIYNNHTLKVEKYECLARLIDEKGTVIAPYHFLGIAKETQLYHKITCTMLRKCIEVFRPTNLDFSVNLSVKDILHKETRDCIIQILNNNPRVARHLVFEIVESEGIEHLEIVTDFIFAIKKYGTRIAIDDFGSGYSNFANILKLKIDYIKIDASLIRNIDFDGNSQIITRSIIWFARELGLETISEYVHSEDVFQKAIELGVDYSQGFFIGEPLPSIEI